MTSQNSHVEELKSLKMNNINLKQKVTQLEFQLKAKEKEVEAAKSQLLTFVDKVTMVTNINKK